ncbi:MAG: amino acid adenylation domain-containing protein [Marinifilaceae bacterium]
MKTLELNLVCQENQIEREYWEKKFLGDWKKSSLPYDFKSGNARTDYMLFEKNLDVDAYNEIVKVSKGNDFNIYVFFVTVLSVMIRKYSEESEVILGTPILKQEQENELINKELIIRCEVEEHSSFKQILSQVKKLTLEATRHQNFPITAYYRKKYQISDNSSSFSLFDVAVLMESLHDISYLQLNHAKIVFAIAKEEQNFKLKVYYDPGYYSEDGVGGIVNNLEICLNAILSDKNISIGNLSLLKENERSKIIYNFNSSSKVNADERTLIEVFQDIVCANRDKNAVVFNGESITYEELDRRSNLVAEVLIDHGYEGKIIGLLTGVSLELIVGIWGILKAGAVFLPIDNTFPKLRIEKLLADSKAEAILIRPEYAIDVDKTCSVIDLTDIDYSANCPEGIIIKQKQDQPLYVMYTSGTTGDPKGVIIYKNNLKNYISWLFKTINLSAFDKVVLNSSYGFDASYTQIFGAILTGAELHLVNREVYMSPNKFLNYLGENKITILHLTPSLLNLLIRSNEQYYVNLETLKCLILGGEAIKCEDVTRLLNDLPDISIMNHYGPTEATIACVAEMIDQGTVEEFKCRPVIGIPINNAHVYILNKDLDVQPVGVVGELHVGGQCVGPGYLNSVELTKDKFIDDPFHDTGKIYKTGDLARWLPNGKIEFLGRKDQQEKINGNRVELGEVENLLKKHNSVHDCKVVIQNVRGVDYLCAYAITSDLISTMELREYLKEYLPDYMIPASIEHVKYFTVNERGKIDLPKPNFVDYNEYVASSNDIETKLVKIWAEVLNLPEEEVSVRGNFFEMGGNSLKIIELGYMINNEFGKELPVAEMFKNPTIESFAKSIVSDIKEQDTTELDEDVEDSLQEMPDRRELLKLRYEGGNKDE